MGKRDNLQVMMKKFWMRTGSRVKMARSEGQENLALGQDNQSQALAEASRGKAGDSQGEGEIIEYIENEDPAKRRVKLPRRVGRLERWFNKQRNFWRPPLTADELDDQAIRKKEKDNFQARKRDCQALYVKISNAYFNCGINYIRKQGYRHEKEKVEKVTFESWGWTQDGATAIGKVENIPYDHRPDELIQPGILNALMCAVEKPVAGRLDANGGGIYISVALAGKLDLPDWVDFNYSFPLIAESQPPLSVFIGIGENGAKHVINLEECPHVLIAGSTGTGKSVCLTSIIATLVARNVPKDLRLLLADLKTMDLSLFTGCPHLLTEIEEIPDGIVRRESQIIPALKWLEQESNRRQAMFGHEQVRSLSEWNRRHRNRYLPRIVFAIDEYARLMRTKYFEKEFISLMYDLSSTSRAVGIYIYACTQYCVSRYVSVDIKMNLNGRIAFSTNDLSGSVAVLDSNEAVGLYPPPGRGIFRLGQNSFRFQGCFISTRQILSIVNSAKQGKTLREIPADTGLSEEEICRWALDENNGYLQTSITFHHFTPRIEQSNLKKLLQDMDGKIYTIDAIDYRVIPAAGARARKLVRAELEQETE